MRTLAASGVEKSTVDLAAAIPVQDQGAVVPTVSEPVGVEVAPNEPPRVKSLLEGLVSAAKKTDLSTFGQGPGAAYAAAGGGLYTAAAQIRVAVADNR